jgi:hypothetical protein
VIPLCMKKLALKWRLGILIEKCIIVCWFNAPSSRLTSCTPFKSILHLQIFLLLLFWMNLTYRDSWHSKFQISCPFPLLTFHTIYPIPMPYETFRNMLFLRRVVINPSPNPHFFRLSATAVFAATFQNWISAPPSATWRRVVPWWHGTYYAVV